MNVMKSRLIMAAYLAMAYDMKFSHLNYKNTKGSPAWAPKRKKLKGWQKS